MDTTITKKKKGLSIYWFRNALRLHDNPSLLEACNPENTSYLLPVYIIDPEYPFSQTNTCRPGPIRANFCLQSIHNLQDKMIRLNSNIVVFLGKPEIILPQICSEFEATNLIYETEAATPIRECDDRAIAAIRSNTSSQVNVKTFDAHTLFGMEQYKSKCTNKMAPSTFAAFRKLFDKMGPVPDEVQQVLNIPPLPLNYVTKLNKMNESDKNSSSTSGITAGHHFNVPSMKEIGYGDNANMKNNVLTGGEDTALKRLDQVIANKTQWKTGFGKRKSPHECLTTGLSPYLRHGCISSRRFYHTLSRIYLSSPNSLKDQLLYREYTHLLGHTTPNFDKMVGNPIIRQIPWEIPGNGDNLNSFNKFNMWKKGKTGYPTMDAIISELNSTGWVHHLARDAIARFLTRGDLWQHWEAGAKYFEETLIDADWCISNYNWQKSSCSAHDFKFTRCASPISFGKKIDPDGAYIRKWLPIFKNFPSKFIYEPWTAPKAIQEEYGIVIGVEYPFPIVDHSMVKQENMDRMKKIYDELKKRAKK